MTEEEELSHLRQEKRLLREQTSLHQETINLQRKLLSRQQEQMTQLSEQVKALQERLAKVSHNSHLPRSSDRFSRQPKSLRKKVARSQVVNRAIRAKARCSRSVLMR